MHPTLLDIHKLKHTPCEKCGGPPDTVGSGLPRTVYYFADRIEVRCKQCGELTVFLKPTPEVR